MLVERRDLSRIEAAAAMEAIMSGAATSAQIAAFLTALRMKGETVEELIGFAQVMRQKVVRIRTRGDEMLRPCRRDAVPARQAGCPSPARAWTSACCSAFPPWPAG